MSKSAEVKGKVWTGFIGECKDRCPCYIIPKAGEDGVFICDVLRKFFRKKVTITIKEKEIEENPIRKWAKHPKVIEARKLLMEADKDLLREYKNALAADRCRCGHSRANHLPSHSINYTEGLCRICRSCKGFIFSAREKL